jgi:hypothetical protein
VKELETHLGVARSSISLWVRDVTLGEAERARLLERTRLGPMVAAARNADRARAIRRAYQERGRQLVHERDGSYAAGCTLYWAEGAKHRNALKLTNSDPDLVAYFLAFLRRHFDVSNERVKIYCNLFADHVERQTEIEDHWLERLALDRSSLRKSTVNVYSKYSQKKRRNKLAYGTCALVVNSTELVQTIYGSIQELGGFDRPAWLD